MNFRYVYGCSFQQIFVLCIVLFFSAGECFAQTGVVNDGTIPVQLNTLVQWDPELKSGSADFELTPTRTVNLKDGTGRILVATMGGTLRMMVPNGSGYVLLPTSLLNSQQMGFERQQESGTTSIALHPDFAGNSNQFGYGKLYTITVEDSANNGGLTNADVDFSYNGEVHQDVVREWDISAIVGQANVNSLPGVGVGDSRELLRIDQPGFCHNVVDLGFDPSASVGDDNYGLLFITAGDGCGPNSERFRDPQDLSRIYGSLLRIDPDPTAHALVRVTSNSTAPNAGQPTYSIPASNPFNGDDAAETRTADTLAEIYAYGFRSPYRMGFDSMTGDMFIGDVGEGSREEVTKVDVLTNAGWGRFEGTRVNANDVSLAGPSPHTEPVFEYTTAIGRTVVGGLVYRGSAIAELQGKYVFADFGNFLTSARLFYGSVDPSDPDFGEIFSLVLDPDGDTYPVDSTGDSEPDLDAFLPDRIFGLSEDQDGEILLIAGQDPRGFLPSVPGAYIIRLEESDLIIKEPNDDPIKEPVVINVDLNYNFNGIVHANESADPTSNPNHPNGFRSISDRALDFRGGIPSNPTLDNYVLVGNGGAMDIVHLGNRNTVSGGGQPFDNQVDGDNLGVQPAWLPDPDQSGRQTSMLNPPVELTSLADVSVVFQVSNGGGNFEVVLGYSDGTEESFMAAGPDWFGPFDGQPNIGQFPGTQNVDRGQPGDELLLTESVFRIPNSLGKIVESISFENASNFEGGVAVVAANIVVEDDCLLGDVNQDGVVNLLDVAPFVNLLSGGGEGYLCEADVNEDSVINLLDVAPFVDLLSGN